MNKEFTTYLEEHGWVVREYFKDEWAKYTLPEITFKGQIVYVKISYGNKVHICVDFNADSDPFISAVEFCPQNIEQFKQLVSMINYKVYETRKI